MNYKEKFCKKGYSHYENSNYISKILFLWLNPIFKLTKNYSFEQDMHYNLPKKYKINNTNKKFYQLLKKHNNNISKCIFDFVNKKFLILLCVWVYGIVNFLSTFIFIKISNINEKLKYNNLTLDDAIKKWGIFWFYLIVVEFLISIISIHLQFYFSKLIIIIKNNIIYLIIKKTLKLSNKGLSSTNNGNIINLVQVDSQRFQDISNYLFFGLFVLINSIFGLIYAFIYIGPVILLFLLSYFLILLSMKGIVNKNYQLDKKLRKIKTKLCHY